MRLLRIVLPCLFLLTICLSYSTPSLAEKGEDKKVKIPSKVTAAIQKLNLDKKKEARLILAVVKYYTDKKTLKKEKNVLIKSMNMSISKEEKADFSSFIKNYSKIQGSEQLLDNKYLNKLKTILTEKEVSEFLVYTHKTRKKSKK